MPHRSITSKDVASLPAPGFNLAESIQFSPDDSFLTYLRSPNRTLSRQLYAYDLRGNREFIYAEPARGDGATEENLSMEEKLRREVGHLFNLQWYQPILSLSLFSVSDN